MFLSSLWIRHSPKRPGTCLESVHMNKCVCACCIYFYVEEIFPAVAGSRTDEYKMVKSFGDEWSNFQKHLTSFDLFIKSITRTNSIFLPQAFCGSWSQDDGFLQYLKLEVCFLSSVKQYVIWKNTHIFSEKTKKPQTKPQTGNIRFYKPNPRTTGAFIVKEHLMAF